ncbi:MAG: hypothetical protein M1825_005025 [Sarcosagium campestre]|nr:MAG: hypothetical protein M1825_005025 [Sarcosagium campestre]
MTDQDGSTTMQDVDSHIEDAPVESKGKGKAVQSSGAPGLDEEEESSDEETGADEPEDIAEEEEEEDMAEIDTGNIITSGRRTRGKDIDFAKAAAENKDELDDDEDDDGDFQEPVDDDDAMQE